MNLIIAIVTVLANILYVVSLPFFWLKSKRLLLLQNNKKRVPSVTEPLLKLNATELAHRIRFQIVKSEEICNAYIKRIKEVNPIVNAVVEDRFESALKEARQVDAFLQTFQGSHADLELDRPLFGVPLTVKESCSLAGSSLCCGTVIRAGIKAEADGEAIAKLRAAGAIPLLVSNTPEICLSWESFNFVTGRTKNPYNTSRTSAGSSGGEGALLGSGASLLGVGSDVAGSIRLPAMFNGVFGHKPTSRTISIKGHFPYSPDEKYADVFAVGPMVRYAADLKVMMKVMAHKTAVRGLRLDETVDLEKVRVFRMTEESSSVFSTKVAKEIKLAVNESVNYLRNSCNCQIVENETFPLIDESCEIAGSVLYNLKDVPNLLKAEKNNLAFEMVKSLIGLSKYTFNLLMFYSLQVLYQKCIINDGYLQKNDQLKRVLTEKLGEDGVFLYPTFPNSAFLHGSSLLNILGVSYLMIFNTLGLPATHVPCGFDKNGLPIGIQVVAGPNQDRLCFAVAEELEKRFGGWQSP